MRIRVLISACASVALLAFVPAAPATPVQGCAAKILREWRTGMISLKYAPSCYRSALANLPEDMRIYSSAGDDIARALQARLTALAARPKKVRVLTARARGPIPVNGERAALGIRTSAADDTLPIPVLVAGGAALLLVGVASASRLAHRLRR